MRPPPPRQANVLAVEEATWKNEVHREALKAVLDFSEACPLCGYLLAEEVGCFVEAKIPHPSRFQVRFEGETGRVEAPAPRRPYMVNLAHWRFQDQRGEHLCPGGCGLVSTTYDYVPAQPGVSDEDSRPAPRFARPTHPKHWRRDKWASQIPEICRKLSVSGVNVSLPVQVRAERRARAFFHANGDLRRFAWDLGVVPGDAYVPAALLLELEWPTSAEARAILARSWDPRLLEAAKHHLGGFVA